MAGAGIEIGVHTYSHPDLGKLADPVMLRKELVEARDDLCAAIGRPARYFAFPFGLYVYGDNYFSGLATIRIPG